MYGFCLICAKSLYGSRIVGYDILLSDRNEVCNKVDFEDRTGGESPICAGAKPQYGAGVGILIIWDAIFAPHPT